MFREGTSQSYEVPEATSAWPGKMARLQETKHSKSNSDWSVKMETYIVSFEINKPYDDWLTHFEQSRPGLESSNIAVLFRGPRKDDSSKVCVILQAQQGEVDKFMEANAPMIAASGHILESTIVDVYKG